MCPECAQKWQGTKASRDRKIAFSFQIARRSSKPIVIETGYVQSRDSGDTVIGRAGEQIAKSVRSASQLTSEIDVRMRFGKVYWEEGIHGTSSAPFWFFFFSVQPHIQSHLSVPIDQKNHGVHRRETAALTGCVLHPPPSIDNRLTRLREYPFPQLSQQRLT